MTPADGIPERFRQTTVNLSEEVLFQEVEGEAVLLDLPSGQYYGLNDVGSRFWFLARQCDDLETIFARMLDEYDVDAATLADDLGAFLDDVAAAGLVRLEQVAG